MIYHIACSSKRRNRVYHRILLAMALNDVLFSIRCFIGTWAIPSNVPYEVYGNVGTTETCTASGFVGQGAALTSMLYNASLTLYFFLTITLGYRQERFKDRILNCRTHDTGSSSNKTSGRCTSFCPTLEVWMHAIPLGVGWIIAIVGLPLQLYNPIGWTCWITLPPPTRSGMRFNYSLHTILIFRWILMYGFLWFVFAFLAITMVVIYWSIRKREKKSLQYDFARKVSKQARDSKEISHGRSQKPCEAASMNTSDDSRDMVIDVESASIQSSQSVPGMCSLDEGSVVSSCRSLVRELSERFRWSTSKDSNESDKALQKEQKHAQLSRRFATQAGLYAGAYFLVYFFPLVLFHVEKATGKFYWPLLLLGVIFLPLQGAFNTLIYLRPRYLNYRERKRQEQARSSDSTRRTPEGAPATALHDGEESKHYLANICRSFRKLNGSQKPYWAAFAHAISLNEDVDDDSEDDLDSALDINGAERKNHSTLMDSESPSTVDSGGGLSSSTSQSNHGRNGGGFASGLCTNSGPPAA